MNARGWLLIGALALAAGYGGYRIMYEPRGIRNNNPGNLRRTAIDWRGERPDSAHIDAEFEVFVSPEWGIRAMALDLWDDYHDDGKDTIRELINEWAPPVENDTSAYVRHVAAAAGVDPDDPIYLPAHWFAIIKAIIQHENGKQPYSDAIIAHALALAGVPIADGGISA